jgi:hypothetical protein
VRFLKPILGAVVLLAASASLSTAQAAASAPTLTQLWSQIVTTGSGSSGLSAVSGYHTGGATVGDLLANGQMDVVVGTPDGRVWAFNGSTGAVLPGWPQSVGGALDTNPSLADLNGDGTEEVIATSESGNVYVWNGNGSLVPGWPQHPTSSADPSGFYGGVAVGDLLGNGQEDLVAANFDQFLYAWAPDGQLLPGFPIWMWDSSWDTPALVNLENKGQLDIVVGVDSSGPPYDPYPSGGEYWAFRPTGCVAGAYANAQPCALPGWPKTFDETPWSSPAVAPLQGAGSEDIVAGTGLNFPAPRGQYVNAWTSTGADVSGWPQSTGGQNFASPAVGSLTGGGALDVVEASTNGDLYAWNSSGQLLPGWPVVTASTGTLAANPTIAPISSTQNGVWITVGAALYAYNSAGSIVFQVGPPPASNALGCGAFAAPAVADLGNGDLSVVTVAQTDCTSSPTRWTVSAFSITGTTRMLADSWPTFHGNSELSGTLTPTAQMSSLPATQSSTAMTVSWSLAAGSPPATEYRVWARDTTSGSPWSFYGHTGATSMTVYGYPGHSYQFTVQAGNAGDFENPGFSTDVSSTTVSASASWATPFKEIYAVDATGNLQPAESAPMLSNSTWPDWNIVSSVALEPSGLGGYILDGYGGVHPFGDAPAVQVTGYWPGWVIAEGIVLCPDGHSGYVLDGYGGLHPFGIPGDIPPAVETTGYWPGWDIAKGVALRPDGESGYVLDGYGGIHPFGVPGDVPAIPQVTAYWPGWDIANSFTLDSAGTGGYVLDGFGGLHPFGTPGNIPSIPQVTGYWPGWDIANLVVLMPGSSTQGWVIDAWGAYHPFGGAPQVQTPRYQPGDDMVGVAVS